MIECVPGRPVPYKDTEFAIVEGKLRALDAVTF